MPKKANTPINADTLNALVDAQAAIVMALAATMPPQQKAAFADALSRLAKNAEANGQLTLETLLIQLYQAARM